MTGRRGGSPRGAVFWGSVPLYLGSAWKGARPTRRETAARAPHGRHCFLCPAGSHPAGTGAHLENRIGDSPASRWARSRQLYTRPCHGRHGRARAPRGPNNSFHAWTACTPSETPKRQGVTAGASAAWCDFTARRTRAARGVVSLLCPDASGTERRPRRGSDAPGAPRQAVRCGPPNLAAAVGGGEQVRWKAG